MEPGIIVVDEAGSLYRVPDYVSAGQLPDTRAGVGDPMPLAIRMRMSLPGKPLGPTGGFGVTGVAQGLTVPDDALSVIVQVQAAAIRYRVDGGTPNATTGFRADPGTILELTGRDTMQAFQVINEGATNASLRMTFWT